MRSIAVTVLGFVISASSFAQGSLCNPCVDPPLRPVQIELIPEPRPIPESTFDMGAAISNLRGLNPSEGTRIRTLMLVDSSLFAAARAVMPEELTDSDIRSVLADGLVREDQRAVAVTLPREDGTLAFVFVRQADGRYAGPNATSVITRSAFASIGWPAEEFERYEIELLSWDLRDGDPSLLRAEVRAWRQGQRYTTAGNFLVSPDGSITNP